MSSLLADDRLIHLDCENELQLILCRRDDRVWLKLIEGSAELFGSDLLLNREYEFSYFSSISIFTWSGCTLKLRKEPSMNTNFNIRISTQTRKMRDLHELIEEFRLDADVRNSDIPVTLITGPTDVGKSTLSRFLLNYAIKCGRRPIFVDLDVGQSSLSITGTFGVLPIHEQSNVSGRFNEKELSVYYFGYKSPGHNMILYKLLLQKVGKSLKIRLKESQRKSSGVIIDTCGWVVGAGYQLIKEIITVLGVNMVLVLSDKSLYSRLMHDVSDKTKLVFVEKFENIFIRKKTVRIDNRENSVYQYFYGSYGHLRPYTLRMKFRELQIFRADNSRNLKAVSVLIEPSIIHQVLALSYAENIDKILLTSVYGFICIMDVDMDSETVTVLSPQPGPLPTNYFIIGDITLIPKEETFS